MIPMKPNATLADAYDSRSIALHWLTAALVGFLWTLGQCIDFFPKDAPRMGARSVHIAAGAALAVVLGVRVLWRLRGARRLPADPGLAGRAAVGMHYLLYALLVVAVGLGFGCVWMRGDTLFNLFTVPAFDPGNEALPDEAVDVHGFVANALLAIAGLHAAAAVFHHRVLKDGVMRRMWPSLSPGRSRRNA
jgi:cytochrome b561